MRSGRRPLMCLFVDVNLDLLHSTMIHRIPDPPALNSCCLDRGGLWLLLHNFCPPLAVLILMWPVGCQQPRHIFCLSRCLCSAKCKASSQAGSGRASAFHNGKTLQRSHCKLHDLQDPQSESGDGAVSHRWSEGGGAGGRARNLQQGRQHPVMPCHPVPRILSASLPAHT